MSGFQQKIKSALAELIPQNHDGYREVNYNSDFYVHVWSLDEGEGHFEFEVIVPHDSDIYREGVSQLNELNGAMQLTESIEQAIETEYGNLDFNLTFYHQDTVTEKVSERPHDVFYSQHLVYDGSTVSRK